jgi:hypothetical protein
MMSAARFEKSIDGTTRTYRDQEELAHEAAIYREFQQQVEDSKRTLDEIWRLYSDFARALR